MAIAGWLRALDAIAGLISAGQRLKSGSAPPSGELMGPTANPGGLTGPLEARLAGVLVAALKEAFDRDRTRLELEQAQLDAERRRAEEAMRLELRRQSGDRAVAHARMLVALAVVAWAVSAALLIGVPSTREMPARGVLAFGWILLLGCAGTAFAFHAQVASWLGALGPGTLNSGDAPGTALGRTAGFLLIAGLAGVTAALLLAL